MLTVGRPTTWSHHNQADEDWSGLLLGVGVSTPICKASKLRRWRREALVVQESLEGAAQNSALPKIKDFPENSVLVLKEPSQRGPDGSWM